MSSDNKEQSKMREEWEKAFFDKHPNWRYLIYNLKDSKATNRLEGWLAACEFMHENMSQSRYNFWKLTRIQKKKINVLVEALDFISGFDSNCEAHSLISNFKKEARQALQKIKELDESEGK